MIFYGKKKNLLFLKERLLCKVLDLKKKTYLDYEKAEKKLFLALENRNRIIIETHSEHFILRIQKMIREKKVKLKI